MSQFSNDKLNLSVSAMKAMAKTLKAAAHWDAVPLAHAAVRSGLRHDAPEPLSLTREGGEPLFFTQLVVWISGDPGSGKSEMAHTWIRDAARSGHRTLWLDTHTSFAKRWSENDVLVIDTRVSENDHKQNAVQNVSNKTVVVVESQRTQDLRTQILEALDPREHRHVHILVDRYTPFSLEHTSRMSMIMSTIHRHAPEGMMVALDEINWQQERSARYLLGPSDKNIKLMCLAQTNGILDNLIEDDDGYLLMQSVKKNKDLYRLNLRTGEGLVRGEGQTIYRDLRYVAGETPSLSLNADARMAIKRLTQDLRSQQPQTHMERLACVARMCGYRSWHAAEGRTY